MKKSVKVFPVVPGSGAAGMIVLFILLSCMDEPVNLSRSHSDAKYSIESESSEALRASENKRTFSAHLTGSQERPTPVVTDGSGEAIFMLSKDGLSLSYKVIINNLENVTQSHIHCGGQEAAGPVVTFLFDFVAEGVTVNGILAEGTITNADIIARPDTEICMGGVANFAQLVEKMRAGEAYINVHTVAYPAGEIRGQIN
jgi:hypothetical protein